MAVICGTTVNTRQLTWDAGRRWFIAEASELPEPGRVWDDACDVGYRLISHRTGRSVVFALSDTRRDGDGDVQVWVFKPIAGDATMELHVLND
jgi:hypothetical protein